MAWKACQLSLARKRGILVLTVPRLAFILLSCFANSLALAQTPQREDEIVANLAGGRVIVHAAKELLIFAAIDQPVEANSIPPRVMNLDSTHVGILLGASEWQLPADPKPVRLDRDFQHMTRPDPRYRTSDLNQAEPDLEAIGVAFLEKLRPLAAQLHHKIDLPSEQPLFELVIVGYAPESYGPEVWVVEYAAEQEQVAVRGDYWQTRVLRPRFTQIYPPEGKHSPRTIVEARYPPDTQGPTLQQLVEGNDPRLARVRSADTAFAKVVDLVSKGQAQKANPANATDFLRAAVPLIAPNARFVMGTLDEQRGFAWIVEPDEPIEKATDDKNRPPEVPSLRRKPQP